RIMIDDATHGHLVDTTIPGGEGWKSNAAGTRIRYTRGPRGPFWVRLRAVKGSPGTFRFVIRGRHWTINTSHPDMPLKGTVIIDSPMALTGQCGETQFSTNQCSFSTTGNAVRCK